MRRSIRTGREWCRIAAVRGLFLVGCTGVLLISSGTALSAFEERPSGARQAGFGGTVHAIPGDFWSAIRNPALLPSLPSLTFGISLIPSPFGLAELTRCSAGGSAETPIGRIALYASGFGFSLYREIEGGLAFGHDIAPGVSAGLALRAYTLSIKGYGSAVSAGVAVGLRAVLADRIEASLLVDNLVRSRIGRSGESVPRTLSASFSLGPLSSLRGILSVACESRYPAESALGIEWAPAEIVRLRCGTSIEPTTFCAGFSLSAAGVLFEYGARWHPDLGLTHTLSLIMVP